MFVFLNSLKKNNCSGLLSELTDPIVLLVLLAFCEKNIVRYFVLFFSMFTGLESFSEMIVPIAYIVLFLAYLRKYGFHMSFGESLVILFVIASIFFSCMIFPINSKYIFDQNNFYNTIFPCLRYFLVGLVILPKADVLNLLGKVSCIAIIVESMFVVFYMMPHGLMKLDDMSRSYQILPVILFALNYAFNEKNIFSWFCFFIGFVYCLSMGSRGPVAVIIVYAFLKFVKSLSLNTFFKTFLCSLVIVVSILFIKSMFFISLLVSIGGVLSKFGFSTRIIDLAVNGQVVTHMSGRDEIYSFLIDKILEHPFYGYGLYGEWQWIDWNAHNIFLELFVHYGIIIGLLLLLWILFIVLKTYFTTTNNNSRDIVLMWMCFVFVRGLFGGSYLNFSMFFLLGFCLRELRRCGVPFWLSFKKK